MFVDECQFLQSKQVLELSEISYKTPVFTYGLLFDFHRMPFSSSNLVLHLCDDSKHLYARCDICGDNYADYNYLEQTPKDYTSNIIIGDSIYKSLCFRCYYTAIQTQREGVSHDDRY